MLVIADELEKRIEQIMDEGKRNRNDILNIIISEDKELMKILELYRQRKNIEEIMIELKIPIDRVRQSVETIDKISKMIDAKSISRHTGKFYRNKVIQNNMPHENEEELNKSISQARKKEINEKKNMRLYLNGFFLEYQQSKRKGNLNKKKLSKNLEKITKMITLLGCKTSDILYLASMYNDLGDYKKTEKLLNLYEPKQLGETDRINYCIIKDETRKIRNKAFVNELYEQGLSPTQIIELCEKEVSEYRAPFLDLKFITKVLKDSYGYGKNKVDEEDELEL